MDGEAKEEVPGGTAGTGSGRRVLALGLGVVGALLLGLRVGWTAGAEAFVVRLYGLELLAMDFGAARVLARAFAPGRAGDWVGEPPVGVVALGWLVLLAAALLGAGAVVAIGLAALTLDRRPAAWRTRWVGEIPVTDRER